MTHLTQRVASVVCALSLSGLALGQACDPRVLGELTLPLVPAELVVRGGFAYAFGGASLAIVDLSDPASPALRGELALPPGGVREASFAGDVLAVAATGSFLLIDVSDPDHPSLLAQDTTPVRATGVDAVGPTVYVADRVCCIIAYDISDPLAPEVLWTDTRGSWGYERVAFDGSIGYVMTSDNPRSVFVREYSAGPIADNLSHFIVIEQLDLIRLDGTIMHTTSDDRYLSVYYSTLESPAIIGETFTATGANITDMAARTPRVTLALGDGGIEILDVRNPEAHAFLASLSFPGGASFVAEIDGLLVVLTGESKLVTLDLTGCADCETDLNADGFLSESDFTAWMHAFNRRYPAADQNGDGLFTAADFTAWIANYNAGC